MATDITVPQLGESVTEATVAKWLKAPGDVVAADEPLVELETDKVTVEVPSPAAGVLAEILAPVGAELAVGGLLGRLGAADEVVASAPAPVAAPAPRRGPDARCRTSTGRRPCSGRGQSGSSAGPGGA
ncbi:biotin/lipoyl-containing protein [Pararhodospirillum photometricum]|uniref:2-oxoglutarate dehydrogenase E2 component n=1 Tax=Pararhodospirillum photometricum DSM 122 TaxID=1150469 RepID=H6SL82_PARPM|nr:biotin/lipoyl-containing protein [Pararhodospirillum photometricum]CCG08747.1 2-oxoglutarate dehydrogenase E2 component [Pararhodospirillum photometricum DSM 122]